MIRDVVYEDYDRGISKRNTLRSVSPYSPCAPDVPGAYNVNSCSGCVRPGSFRPEVKGLRPMCPDALDAALSLPDGMRPGGRTQNRSLRYKRLEHLAHRVSGESQNARYFFC